MQVDENSDNLDDLDDLAQAVVDGLPPPTKPGRKKSMHFTEEVVQITGKKVMVKGTVHAPPAPIIPDFPDKIIDENLMPGYEPMSYSRQDQKPIAKFDADVTTTSGYGSNAIVNIKRNLEKKLGGKLDSLSLGRPAVNKDWQDHLMIGTDNPEAKRHYILCLSSGRMIDHIDLDPIVHHVQVNAPCRDMKHITNNATLIALTDSMHVFKVNDAREIFHGGALHHIHGSSIREVAVNMFDPLECAAGGNDKILSVFNINEVASSAASIRSVKLPSTIGSVKYGVAKENESVVSLTTDNGSFFMMDTRMELKKPVYQLHTNSKELYTHDFASEHNFLLGYGNGLICSADIRNSQVMGQVKDPLCQTIGDIQYSPKSTAFVTSGFTNFSVWNHQVDTQYTKLWSHKFQGVGVAQIDKKKPTYRIAARFMSDGETVVTADSAGMVGIYKQDFAFLPKLE